MSTELDLQKFCANVYDPRPYLRAPMAHRGYRIATNGHIMVRLLNPADNGAFFQAPAPYTFDGDKAMAFFKDRPGVYTSLPEFEDANRCIVCLGLGKYLAKKCPDCFDGWFTHGENNYECKTCETDDPGFVEDDGGEPHPCRTCDCLGYIQHRQAIGQKDFDVRYLMMVRALPKARYAIVGDVMHFVFDGGDGVLQSMRSI
jgi:hypothetical protein